MTDRENLINQFQIFLGEDFKYYYDEDILENQISQESECKNIHFKFQPPKKNINCETGKIFETKLNELKLSFPQYEIYGGKAMWFGYFLTIEIKTFEKTEKEKVKKDTEHLNEQLEILKSTCGV